MDNVIWIIIAAAVMIALAGIILFMGSTNLSDIGNETDGIIDREPGDFMGFEENIGPKSLFRMSNRRLPSVVIESFKSYQGLK